ncbi:ABC transporter permease [Halostella sp. JP-L12]|uniref:ABC transporter permease n=1 Tax=Halostella TaxID=1843185 RepID=UPI000EF7FC49|nr:MULTISPECIES: ABC transporter permease [Halostella]NHN46241.1 ABC transporter permease [Halostella sp. JP-L12]
MTWEVVAKKDFADAVRSRGLWALSALFVLVFALPPLLIFYLEFGQNQPAQAEGSTDAFIFIMKEASALLVPVIAIVVAYAAITSERESGTMKILLSLPHSRRDVVAGKVLGRSAVLAVPIAVGFLFSLLVMLPTSLSLKLANFTLFGLLTVLFGVVFVGLAVGLSAAFATSRRAMMGSLGLFMLFTFLWNFAVNTLIGELDLGAGTAVRTRLFLKLLNPTQAYKTLVDALIFDTSRQARVMMFGFFEQQRAQELLPETLPVHFSDPFVVAYMLLWFVVPVGLGYLVFRDAEL